MRTKYAAVVLVLPFAFVMGLSLMLRAQRTNPASAPPGTFDAVIEQNHGDLFNLGRQIFRGDTFDDEIGHGLHLPRGRWVPLVG